MIVGVFVFVTKIYSCTRVIKTARACKSLELDLCWLMAALGIKKLRPAGEGKKVKRNTVS